MELYDRELEQKKSQIPMIIGICITILVIITILIIFGIIYLRNSITTIQIDGTRNSEIEEIFYFESTEEGQELYLPIIRISQFLGYEGYNGDYKDKSEDRTKCHVISEDETAMFTLNSDTLIKVTEDSETEYIQLDKETFEKDGELYTTIEGIEKAFNVSFYYDEDFKNISIYTMDYLIQYYTTRLGIEEYSTNFADKKAIFENMIIIEANNQYGVINAENGNSILETKYEEISYIPATTDFLVRSNGKYGIVTKNAETMVRTVYDEIKAINYQKELYLVKQNNTYGIINVNGEVIIEPDYKQIGLDISRYAQNGVDNGYILLDEIIPVKNENDLWGFFNIQGEKIVDFKYTGVGCQSTPVNNSYPTLVIPSYKIIVVQANEYYNLINIQGEELVPENIVDSIYLRTNTATGQNQFYMTSNDGTRVANIEEWLASIGE